MHRLGERLADLLGPGDLVVLSGGLGAGKTTLTQGIGRGLHVRGEVTSPTFVIARVHPSTVGGPALVHVDAFRLSSLDEVDDLDLDASLEDVGDRRGVGRGEGRGARRGPAPRARRATRPARRRASATWRRTTGGAPHRVRSPRSGRGGPGWTSTRCSPRRRRHDAARVRHVVRRDHRRPARRHDGGGAGLRDRGAGARRAARARRSTASSREPASRSRDVTHARRRRRPRPVHRPARRSRDRARSWPRSLGRRGVRRVLARRRRRRGGRHGLGRRAVRRGDRRATQGGLPRGVRRRRDAARGTRGRPSRPTSSRTSRPDRSSGAGARLYPDAFTDPRAPLLVSGRVARRRTPSDGSPPGSRCSTRARCTCAARTPSSAPRASG